MKPRIFIGSSTEGLAVAQRIKTFFEPDYDCYIWNDGIFQFNEGFLETLLKSASLFDFGFMVFAADEIIGIMGIFIKVGILLLMEYYIRCSILWNSVKYIDLYHFGYNNDAIDRIIPDRI